MSAAVDAANIAAAVAATAPHARTPTLKLEAVIAIPHLTLHANTQTPHRCGKSSRLKELPNNPCNLYPFVANRKPVHFASDCWQKDTKG